MRSSLTISDLLTPTKYFKLQLTSFINDLGIVYGGREDIIEGRIFIISSNSLVGIKANAKKSGYVSITA
jgi:hypothetical protein